MNTNSYGREMPSERRRALWVGLLEMDTCEVDYAALSIIASATGVAAAPGLRSVEDVINVDVQRSFVHIKEVEPAVLKRVLRAFAVANPEIEYCQGMNFLAGFLMLFFRDE